MDSFVIGDVKFNLQITHRSATSLKLKIISPTDLEIICHRFTPQFVIKNFLQEHQKWILSHRQKLPAKTDFTRLKKLQILENTYQIIINKTTQDSVIISDIEQIIYINTSILSSSHIKSILESRLRRLARLEINSSLKILKDKWGFVFQKVSIKNQSSRFGSCSSLGNLNFNWQIILLPREQFSHILLHELNHLKIKNHQAEFWYQLAIYDPNCFQNNRLLKKAARDLLIFA